MTEPGGGSERIDLKRFLWAGPVTVLTSALAVLLIRTAAVTILKPAPAFLPLSSETPIADTVMLGTAAVFVLLSMCRYSLEPIREYRSLASKVLLVSLVPDIALAIGHWFGGGWPEATALMLMHVAVWAICVTMLPCLVAPASRSFFARFNCLLMSVSAERGNSNAQRHPETNARKSIRARYSDGEERRAGSPCRSSRE
jgi:hypothetical protein